MYCSEMSRHFLRYLRFEYHHFTKDSYSLLNINKSVDHLSDYKLLSFIDAYYGYNQIPMHESDREKTAFMTQ